ncbi:MAG: methylase [Solirubrobacterales bacterium]|nr:methylase [Solirubrobacterales bacterium]
MLPPSLARINALPDDAVVLDVGGWGGPLHRADHVLDMRPYETRGVLGSYGPGPERFTKDTWHLADICARDPWPFADDQFDFAVCVLTLEDVRDPIGVCRELSRVAKAGYVEVPTVEAELIYNVEWTGPFLGHEHHRWFCDSDPESDPGNPGLVFWHKSHMIHQDWRLRVLPRWRAQMSLEDHLIGLFWEGEITAREHFELGPDLDALAARVRRRFQPSGTELALKAARERATDVAARGVRPVRGAVAKALGRLDRR